MFIALKKHSYLLLSLLLILSSQSFAQQDDVYYSILPAPGQVRDGMDEPSMNAKMVVRWDGAELRELPGEKRQTIGTLAFGEEVELVGRKAFVISEKREYLEVRLASNPQKVGWVKKDLLADGGLVVVLRNTEYYKDPNTLEMESELAFFEAGELAILTDFMESGERIRLVGKNKTPDGKTKEGWIQGTDQVSVYPNDLLVASLIDKALQSKDPRDQRQMLIAIRNRPEYRDSNMEIALEYAIHRTYYSAGSSSASSKPSSGSNKAGSSGSNRSGTASSGGRKSTTTKSSKSNTTKSSKSNTGSASTFVVEKVVDMETGKYYNRITETGPIMEVAGPRRPKDIYWCYHKTRPIGSKVLLHTPDGGRVALTVVARLKSSNPNAIGLGKEVLLRFYGTRFAKTATFSYPQ
ncbi:MAG: hypothetical protein D6730_09860 [Bacteroidetes bacterium]|nr:MAG: hypothetical protein D6730_09860 [Bacteroidota bacterium]